MVRFIFSLFLSAAVAPMVSAEHEHSKAAGEDTTTRTEVLKAGSALLQTDAPLEAMNVYLVGFHPMKDHPAHQMEAHHFCRQVNEDFAQCALFDGNTAQSNLNGIEYIISSRLFESLPEAEKQFWHPHNYEVLSGQLIAPGLPRAAETELMRSKMNSYGKTWHVWDTGALGHKGQPLPMGPPMLAWSFNRDGEVQPALEERRNRRMDVDVEDIRRSRQSLRELARPQVGVDVLKDKFPAAAPPPPGVDEAK